MEKHKKEDRGSGHPGINMRPYLKTTRAKWATAESPALKKKLWNNQRILLPRDQKNSEVLLYSKLSLSLSQSLSPFLSLCF
jgi:hypothetical protein